MNIMVFTTFSNMEEARRIAGILLEEKAAACVQLKEIESLYMWKEKIEEDKEIQGLIKTRRELFNQVEEIIKREHSYEVPQIVAVDIESGSEAYLQWIGEVTR